MSLFNENFYTDDFDQEMLDYVRNLGSISNRTGIDTDIQTKYKYLKYGSSCDYFWTNNITITLDEYKYLTKQQFREKVGMTQKQFTKADLKTGMVVKYRGSNEFSLANLQNGLRLMVAGFAISEDCFNKIDDYSDDLIYAPQKSFNIDEIFNVVSLGGGLQNIENWTLKSIWKRPEPVEAPPVPSAEQIEIASIQAEMDKLNERLQDLKGKV